jgi:pimeloyl-ACP methyl ester carboxylesterase
MWSTAYHSGAAMSVFVLVHGAWHGGWCWRKVIPLLEKDGHTVFAPDLPGHGNDRTPPSNISFAAYTERVCDAIDSATEPVILAGHSMAGAVISQAAENRPAKVRVLVYVCAYLLRNGQSLRDAAAADKTNKVNSNLVFSDDRSVMTVREEAIADAFYGICPAEDVAWAKPRLVPEATNVWRTPVQLTEERFGRIPRVYVECLRDQAIPLGLQRQMCSEAAPLGVLSIDTDHSPFFSAPSRLADLLLKVGEAARERGSSGPTS